MTADSVSGVEIFFSYAHEDERLREQLEKHLRFLSSQDLSVTWHDHQIRAGTEWAQEIDAQLESASIILLLISSNFLASDYCYGREMQRALERQRRNETRIIPVILKPCDWQTAPFADLQCLPRDTRPVMMWDNLDEAFNDVAKDIREIVEEISFKKSRAFLQQLRSERKKRGWTLDDLAQKINVSPRMIQRWEAGKDLPSAHMRRELAQLFGNEELLLAFSRRKVEITPSPTQSYSSLASRQLKSLTNISLPALSMRTTVSTFLSRLDRWYLIFLGRLFLILKLYNKALSVYEKALLVEPCSIHLHIGKGDALLSLKRNNEALAAYEQAIDLAPNSSIAYERQGKAFEQLAQQAFDEIKQQAQQCYEKAKQLGVE